MERDILTPADKARIRRQLWEDTPMWAKVIVIGGPLYILFLALCGLAWVVFVRGTLFP